jgi:hypothetical protein
MRLKLKLKYIFIFPLLLVFSRQAYAFDIKSFVGDIFHGTGGSGSQALTFCFKNNGAVFVIGGGFKKAGCKKNEQLFTLDLKGATGDKGPAGDKGPTGDKGPVGDRGAVGPAGSQGPVGNQGVVGLQGPLGAKGPTGDKGPDGDQGPVGPQGPQGLRGDAGKQFKVYDSQGNYLGLLIQMSKPPYRLLASGSDQPADYVVVYNEEYGKFIRWTPGNDERYPFVRTYYKTDDCTGTPYVHLSDTEQPLGWVDSYTQPTRVEVIDFLFRYRWDSYTIYGAVNLEGSHPDSDLQSSMKADWGCDHPSSEVVGVAYADEYLPVKEVTPYDFVVHFPLRYKYE